MEAHHFSSGNSGLMISLFFLAIMAPGFLPGAYREVDGETHKVLQPFVHCSGFAFDMDFA